MLAVLVFYKRNPFAFKRLGNNHHWLAFSFKSSLVSTIYLFKIMAIDDNRFPAKCPGLLFINFRVMTVHSLASLSKPIHIKNRNEIIKFVVRAPSHSFPH